MTELDLTNPENFPHWTDEIIRFADLDRLDHVNNVMFATYSESGRVAFLEEVDPGSTGGNGVGWVIAKLTVNFLAAAYYPGTVRIGTVVRRIGNSSIGVEQGLFSNGKCFATCENILVWADTKNEKSLPLSDEMKEKLRAYLKE
ncbi:MAG: acyl-CoA thioesterase [Methylocystaceae bacterium]|nr:acyl-CoA thioesterase [Methylocystaceae bacterium]